MKPDDGGRKATRRETGCWFRAWTWLHKCTVERAERWSGLVARSLSGCRVETGSSCTRKWEVRPVSAFERRLFLSSFLLSVPLFRWRFSVPTPAYSRIAVSHANVPEPIALSNYDRLNNSLESLKFVIGSRSLASEECD